MGYVESRLFFCTYTETLKDTVNTTMTYIQEAPKHPLENVAETHPSGDTGSADQTKVQAHKDWSFLHTRASQEALS